MKLKAGKHVTAVLCCAAQQCAGSMQAVKRIPDDPSKTCGCEALDSVTSGCKPDDMKASGCWKPSCFQHQQDNRAVLSINCLLRWPAHRSTGCRYGSLQLTHPMYYASRGMLDSADGRKVMPKAAAKVATDNSVVASWQGRPWASSLSSCFRHARRGITKRLKDLKSVATLAIAAEAAHSRLFIESPHSEQGHQAKCQRDQHHQIDIVQRVPTDSSPRGL